VKDLIAALHIFLKYGDPRSPTHCEHDLLTICGIDPAVVSDEDKQALERLSFFVHREYGEDQFGSFRFGSA
jgi:hypothetical protein